MTEDHLRNVADNAYAKGEPGAVLKALVRVRQEALEEAAQVTDRYAEGAAENARRPYTSEEAHQSLLAEAAGLRVVVEAIRALKGDAP